MIALEIVVPDAVTDPWAYIAVVAVGLIVFGIRALAAGSLRTGREVEAMRDRLKYLEEALRIRDEQVDAALAVLPSVAEVLRKFHMAADETRSQ